jgi:hypothetical protein
MSNKYECPYCGDIVEYEEGYMFCRNRHCGKSFNFECHPFIIVDEKVVYLELIEDGDVKN